ncbi:uncharacterized protein K444DRAFT_371807 [Hyaloscypha bicolor E]|uniref:Uncharacterized protein n=1 Tax=Hyaloscypha bicolor E TaxID=1095630 RepID=A0A2J6TER3_9HELO|nr:uncharacterized protein K444DRAFT_371807 [Hyaloscypha bicolor E]PMD61500.1 hypothetical protein K444DRAFT_371807 [Hyaloscypha bicolor E]
MLERFSAAVDLVVQIPPFPASLLFGWSVHKLKPPRPGHSPQGVVHSSPIPSIERRPLKNLLEYNNFLTSSFFGESFGQHHIKNHHFAMAPKRILVTGGARFVGSQLGHSLHK